MTESSIAPLAFDFEDCGALAALRRLCAGIDADFGPVPPLPTWLLACRLSDASSSAAREDARQLAAAFWRLEARVYGETPSQSEDGHVPGADAPCALSAVALARLAFGACCEAYATVAATRLAASGEAPESGATSSALCRLYSDASLAAVWTSAHATHLEQALRCGIACEPTLHSVLCEAAELDLSDLYARRTAPRPLPSKDAGHMLALMTRCTNPGSRGWDSVVKMAVEKSVGARRMSTQALAVSLAGMHASIHPAERLRWRERLVLQGLLSATLTGPEVIRVVDKCMVEFKECMRRMTSHCTGSAYATMAALAHVDHPLALLRACPFRLPPPGVEASSTAFMRAGQMIAEGRGTADVAACIKRAFAQQAAIVDGHLTWRSSFLGKGTASVHNKVPAMHMAAEVWTTAFRCNFIPFWAHSACHKLRALRLDAVQHEAVHALNAATRLTLLLRDEERMRLQRIALREPAAGIMTLKEVGTLLNIPGVQGSSCNGGSKGCSDAVVALGGAGGANAARLLAFCRAAWISEEILIYDLGPRTTRLQVCALRKRLLLPESDADGADPLAGVPEHARNLCACIECKRVANAVVADGGVKWWNAFNELGTSGSMVSVNPETREVELRCAKRSSASLRTAVAFEGQMRARAVECEPCDDEALHAMVANHGVGGETGASARVRRDGKSTLQQRRTSVACGHERMLSIPIVGRAVRLWNEWYALCAYCGCFVRFYPTNRVGAEICCMRCDHRMLHRTAVQPATARDAAAAVAQCRYCARVDPQRSGTRWRMVRAPLDTSGRNAVLPPPLRTVFFCPQHFRAWIPQVMKSEPTRVILSHIVFGARPMFDTRAEDAAIKAQQRENGGGARKRTLGGGKRKRGGRRTHS